MYKKINLKEENKHYFNVVNDIKKSYSDYYLLSMIYNCFDTGGNKAKIYIQCLLFTQKAITD